MLIKLYWCNISNYNIHYSMFVVLDGQNLSGKWVAMSMRFENAYVSRFLLYLLLIHASGVDNDS